MKNRNLYRKYVHQAYLKILINIIWINLLLNNKVKVSMIGEPLNMWMFLNNNDNTLYISLYTITRLYISTAYIYIYI